MTQFIKFSDCHTEAVHNDPSESTIAGEPKHTAWPHFVGNNGDFRSGVWESTAGVFRGPMNNQIEFCHIIEGEARIVIGGDDPQTRQEFTVTVGDSFVMDNGLQPVWHVDRFVKKHFVIAAVTGQ